MKSLIQAAIVTVISLAALATSGCGPSHEGLQIRGTVTVNGEPLNGASISFEPDTSKQTTGLTAYAPIVDGKFETNPERGVSEGAYIVRIMPPTIGSEQKVTSPMKKIFQTETVISPEQKSYDFDVPVK